MSRQSESNADISPLNRTHLVRDNVLLMQKFKSIGEDVRVLHDKHGDLIGSETSKISDKVHDAEYFLCGMRDSLFNTTQYCVVPKGEVHAVPERDEKRPHPEREQDISFPEPPTKKYRGDDDDGNASASQEKTSGATPDSGVA